MSRLADNSGTTIVLFGVLLIVGLFSSRPFFKLAFFLVGLFASRRQPSILATAAFLTWPRDRPTFTETVIKPISPKKKRKRETKRESGKWPVPLKIVLAMLQQNWKKKQARLLAAAAKNVHKISQVTLQRKISFPLKLYKHKDRRKSFAEYSKMSSL